MLNGFLLSPVGLTGASSVDYVKEMLKGMLFT